ALEIYKAQLNLWDGILRRPELLQKSDEPLPVWYDRLADVIFQEDAHLAPFNAYPPQELWRERFFLKNSIEGFMRFYEEQRLETATI
ncbi:MAG: hypothetical protein ACRCTY_02485, partial [Candidatus Adiutrix sp.]